MESKPWFCYLLVSPSGKTYVGATVDPNRRLRQHNCEIKGGARRTRAVVLKGELWSRVCYVGPFPDDKSALQFEWMWKHLSKRGGLEVRKKALSRLLDSGKSTSKSSQFTEFPEPLVIVWTQKSEICFEEKSVTQDGATVSTDKTDNR